MLEKMIAKGMCSEASEDVCRRHYDILCDALKSAGYDHYEISNFALAGYRARHNSAYWEHVPYIGLGPGAHSFLDGRRMWNKEDLSAYLEAGKTGDFSIVQGGEVLDQEQMIMERIMLGLRTAEGAEMTLLRDYCSAQALDEALKNGNLILFDNGRIRIPENRFFISDNIITSII
jgi:oxygen-independent coproporphyrinogen-3 oxidase